MGSGYMITTTTIYRWRKHKKGFSYVETTPARRRVSWIDEHHVYYHLGMVKKA